MRARGRVFALLLPFIQFVSLSPVHFSSLAAQAARVHSSAVGNTATKSQTPARVRVRIRLLSGQAFGLDALRTVTQPEHLRRLQQPFKFPFVMLNCSIGLSLLGAFAMR